MTKGLLMWLAYGVLGLALEAWGLIRPAGGDTLSYQVWRLLGYERRPAGFIWARRCLFVASWCWLTIHFFGERD